MSDTYQPRFRPWSKIEDDLLIDIAKRGHTAQYAANHIGRSRNAVLGRSHRLKARFRRQKAVDVLHG